MSVDRYRLEAEQHDDGSANNPMDVDQDVDEHDESFTDSENSGDRQSYGAIEGYLRLLAQDSEDMSDDSLVLTAALFTLNDVSKMPAGLFFPNSSL